MPEELPPVSLDYVEIDQVLSNLDRERRRVTRRPGTPIVVSASIEGRDAVVEVSDDGPGVPADALARVFEPFFRGASGGTPRGTGLGLAVARGLVEAHGGHISVRNRPEGGAVFRFTLPIERTATTRTAATDTVIQQTGARILLVDDEPAIVRAVRANLGSRGFRVDVAESGGEALERVELHPDLILLDLGLPDLDGLDLIRTLRGRARAPIIVLSARGAERDKVRALDLGADDYLTKPFGVEELLARIRVALRHTLRAGSGRAGIPHTAASSSISSTDA